MFMRLNDLKVGQKCKIISINSDIKQRLLDLGLIKGSIINKVLDNKGMNAYNIKGTVIAIRKEDTKDIEVKLI